MTIAQQLKVKDFPFIINDKAGGTIYREDSNGYWYKREFDSWGNVIYRETSNGDWDKHEYCDGKEIYFENSKGRIRDKRPKKGVHLTMDEIATKFNIDVSTLKIKK